MKPADFAAMLAGLRVEVPMRDLPAMTGLSRSHLYRILQGDVRRPSHDTVERLERALKIVPHTGQKRR